MIAETIQILVKNKDWASLMLHLTLIIVALHLIKDNFNYWSVFYYLFTCLSRYYHLFSTNHIHFTLYNRTKLPIVVKYSKSGSRNILICCHILGINSTNKRITNFSYLFKTLSKFPNRQ